MRIIKFILSRLWMLIKVLSLTGALVIWVITSINVQIQFEKAIGIPDQLGDYITLIVLWLGMWAPVYLVLKPFFKRTTKEKNE